VAMPSDLRSAFPVFERLSYLNAGSVGPVPQAAFDAVAADLRGQVEDGRASPAQFERLLAMAQDLRARIADWMGCRPGDVGLTGATTDGVNAVISGLELGPGDEVLTSDEEHPGLLAPLGLARRRRGISVRSVPFREVAGEVGPDTRLVACSHVSWHTGRVADSEALAACDAPVLLDGAQGLGAVAVDIAALGCDYYAASGQKWLCGPVGSGYVYVAPGRLEELMPSAPGYGTLSDPLRALELPLREGAARYDSGMPPSHHTAWCLASLDVLEAEGREAVTTRGPELAGTLAAALAERGLRVAPRDDSTLVSWETADPVTETARLASEGFLVRNLPGTSYVRASIGAWSDEEELSRLADTATSAS
jgi:selenocysteine lyase/cysteine desulfurase